MISENNNVTGSPRFVSLEGGALGKNPELILHKNALSDLGRRFFSAAAAAAAAAKICCSQRRLFALAVFYYVFIAGGGDWKKWL
jgi:hypothetical protein